MRAPRLAGLIFTSLVLTAGSASAQDDPRVGVVMAYPSAAGFIWHLSERIAIRPEISFERGSTSLSTDRELVTRPDDTTWLVGTGISGLVYVHRSDALRAYLSPRFAYAHTSASSPGTFSDGETTGTMYQGVGSFGAQYALGRRFALFGEIGVGYTRTTTRIVSTITISVLPPGSGLTPIPTTTVSEYRSDRVGTRSGVGVIFYF